MDTRSRSMSGNIQFLNETQIGGNANTEQEQTWSVTKVIDDQIHKFWNLFNV